MSTFQQAARGRRARVQDLYRRRSVLPGCLCLPAPLPGVTVKRRFSRSCSTVKLQPELNELKAVRFDLTLVNEVSLESILKAI